MTTLTDICTAIQTIGSGISGVKTAFDPPPAKLLSGQLPAQYALTGPSKNNEAIYGIQMVEVTRTIRIQIAVLPIGQGDPASRETLIRPLIDAAKAAYWSHPLLTRLATVKSCRVTYDTGPVILTEYGMAYIGFELGLEVVTAERRTLAKGE